jgi:hypothetical protein
MDSITAHYLDKSSGHTHTHKYTASTYSPYITQTINENTSAESDLVTAGSTAYKPTEDGLMGRPKHVGVTPPKCF